MGRFTSTAQTRDGLGAGVLPVRTFLKTISRAKVPTDGHRCTSIPTHIAPQTEDSYPLPRPPVPTKQKAKK